MPRDLAFAVAREGRAVGFARLHLTGGEPLLWPHFFELCEYADRLGYEGLLFNTNASLLDDAACRKLRQFGEKLRLTISINGPRENHDATRGVGSYEPAIAGLERALAYSLRVEVFTTVERRLLKHLARFVADLFERHPGIARLVLIQNHRVSADFYEIGDQLLSPAECVQMVRIAVWLARSGYPLAFLDHSLVNVLVQRLGDPVLPASPNGLRYGHLCVLQDGRITPSHSNRQAFASYSPGALGNLLKSSEYRRAVAAADVACAGCAYLAECRAGGHPRPSPPEYYDRSPDENVRGPYCRRVLDWDNEC
jgi:MoaA/NifB/PqqE/SkfB family radical SAM enzyme